MDDLRHSVARPLANTSSPVNPTSAQSKHCSLLSDRFHMRFKASNNLHSKIFASVCYHCLLLLLSPASKGSCLFDAVAMLLTLP